MNKPAPPGAPSVALTIDPPDRLSAPVVSVCPSRPISVAPSAIVTALPMLPAPPSAPPDATVTLALPRLPSTSNVPALTANTPLSPVPAAPFSVQVPPPSFLPASKLVIALTPKSNVPLVPLAPSSANVSISGSPAASLPPLIEPPITAVGSNVIVSAPSFRSIATPAVPRWTVPATTRLSITSGKLPAPLSWP